jgi:hypothetical protein
MRTVTPDGFEDLMVAYAAAVGRDYAQAVRAVGFEWFAGVIRRTKPDTGRMRGNWLTSAGAPNFSVTDRTDESGALADARNNIDPFGVTYLTNNLPYAERREHEGFAPVVGSKRNPFQYGQGVGGGFVEEELTRVVQNMERIVKNA